MPRRTRRPPLPPEPQRAPAEGHGGPGQAEEAEAQPPRIAEVLGLPDGAWPSLTPSGPIAVAPDVTVDLAEGTVTGPAGLQADLTVLGKAGSELSALVSLADAATLEENYWAERIDGAAHVSDIEYSIGQPGTPSQREATRAPMDQPAGGR